jgi:general stress protein YciG
MKANNKSAKTGKRKVGFAAMSKERRREVASKGGKAAARARSRKR